MDFAAVSARLSAFSPSTRGSDSRRGRLTPISRRSGRGRRNKKWRWSAGATMTAEQRSPWPWRRRTGARNARRTRQRADPDDQGDQLRLAARIGLLECDFDALASGLVRDPAGAGGALERLAGREPDRQSRLAARQPESAFELPFGRQHDAARIEH